MKRILSFCLVTFLLGNTGLKGQSDGNWAQKPNLAISGFADVFYVYDFNRPQGPIRQPFLYNHNRHNEFNLNLGLLKLALENPKYRVALALQTGTYANDNYAAEPGVLKHIFEAHIGVSLNAKNDLWLDAGILPSHIGFESAISMDNPTLTRSILAENSPYFLTGAKLGYTPNEKWEIAVLLVNGWQRIERLEGNSLLSFGTQLTYSPKEDLTLNWSTFIGTDDPDPARRMRYFNNLYGQFRLTPKLDLTAGFDLGIQQDAKGSSRYDTWLSPILIGQYSLNQFLKTAVRVEYYQDKTGIIIPTETTNGFQTTGISLNLDYLPISNLVCRLEGRWINSKDPIFGTRTSPSNNNFIIAASIAVGFLETLGN